MASNQKKLPPNQTPIKEILRWGTDHPTIAGSVPHIDLNNYVLTLEGEIEKPLALNWNKIQTISPITTISDFHCVEGWSVLDCQWKGVRFKDLTVLARTRPSAHFVTFECADGYSTALSIEELSKDDVLLAYELNGKPLEQGYGFPLRLVVPDKYAYKSALWVTRIRYTAEKEIGFWEKRGYSDSADVWKNDRFSEL